MSESQPGPIEGQRSSSVMTWQARIKALLPYLLTALGAVAASLLIQTLLLPSRSAVPPTATPAPIEQTAAPTQVPATAAPAASPLPQPDERILSQEILDLRAELGYLRSAFFLMRAANQLADAEAALSINDLEEVERVLVTAKISLDRAYDLSAEQEKGPIGEFRVQIGRMRNDLRIRPEGMDQRLRRLRQDMLGLADQ